MQQPSNERALVVVVPPASSLIAPADALVRITRLVLGATGLAVDALQALLETTVPGDHEATGAGRAPPGPPMIPGAAIGLYLEAQRRSLRAASRLSSHVTPAVAIAIRPLVAHGPLASARRRIGLEDWSMRGLAEQRRNQLAATAFLRALIGGVVRAVLEQVDLDSVVARVDLDQIIERLDLDAIVARVDIEAIIRRVDVAGVVDQVMDEVDIAEIVRESSSTMATETVDALRIQGMNADRVLGRIVDRVLRRGAERQTGPAPAPAGALPPAQPGEPRVPLEEAPSGEPSLGEGSPEGEEEA